MAENLRRTCLSILRSGQSPAGGWGPVRHRGAAGIRYGDGRAGAQLCSKSNRAWRDRRIVRRS